MKRIVVVGATGSGKTTLAAKLAEGLGLAFIDLDEFYWLPGWQMRTPEEFRALTDEATAKRSWAISGNYRVLRDLVWPRADTVVWLDYPFSFVFWRLLKRSLMRVIDKKVICNGNRENFRKLFSRDSIMMWLFKSYWRRKREFTAILEKPEAYPHITFIRLTSPAETEKWLACISSCP